VQIEQGWGLLGMGAKLTNDPSGYGRLITSIKPSDDLRTVSVASRDHVWVTGGATQAFAIVARRRPGTHGLCNPGAKMDSWVDSCVMRICQQRGQCCNTAWDSTCVEMVDSVCGRSCAEHTCVPSVYEPEKWESADGTPVESNCWYYATNRLPDGSFVMYPGMELDLREDDNKSRYNFPAYAAGEGLIPTTFDGVCTENRTKVFLGINGGSSNYWHFIRRDSNGIWSDKFGSSGYAEIEPDSGVSPYADQQHHSIEAYFCACNQALPQ
jgi:hypothetical protein